MDGEGRIGGVLLMGDLQESFNAGGVGEGGCNRLGTAVSDDVTVEVPYGVRQL